MIDKKKKLIWFRSELILSHLSESDTDKWYDWLLQESIFSNIVRPSSLDWHLAMKRAVKIISTPIDGTYLSQNYGDGLDLLRLPHNNGVLTYNLDNGKYIDEHFDDLIENQTDLALDHAEYLNVDKIFLSYSGGSDSSLLVAAFFQNPRLKKWIKHSKVYILTSRFAQREDPEIWTKLLSYDVPFVSIDYDSLINDQSNWMLVSGEGEPYGTFFISQTDAVLPPNEQLLSPWNHIEKVFLRREPSGLAWSYFQNLMKLAPFPVETLHQAWWWYENCVDRQDDMFRYNAFSSYPILRKDCVGHGDRCFYFLSGQNFLDHAAYLILNKKNSNKDKIKYRSDEYVSKWMGFSQVKIKPKFYSMDKVPRHNYKLRIFDDWSWDAINNLDEYL